MACIISITYDDSGSGDVCSYRACHRKWSCRNHQEKIFKKDSLSNHWSSSYCKYNKHWCRYWRNVSISKTCFTTIAYSDCNCSFYCAYYLCRNFYSLSKICDNTQVPDFEFTCLHDYGNHCWRELDYDINCKCSSAF